ncbi:hypothetical protein DAEQUDRAFT_723285 [Daedalea quercina L-15889]|uniref:Uncharacterized protein n=1 Tax=Daedalea quercina L-15889 TaxID=1314783 RepID=A0A165SK65_9APHY|nr:hypothetical protein DAEQUDRAFT_723285 [Daedalea quercina L-15889]
MPARTDDVRGGPSATTSSANRIALGISYSWTCTLTAPAFPDKPTQITYVRHRAYGPRRIHFAICPSMSSPDLATHDFGGGCPPPYRVRGRTMCRPCYPPSREARSYRT